MGRNVVGVNFHDFYTVNLGLNKVSFLIYSPSWEEIISLAQLKSNSQVGAILWREMRRPMIVTFFISYLSLTAILFYEPAISRQFSCFLCAVHTMCSSWKFLKYKDDFEKVAKWIHEKYSVLQSFGENDSIFCKSHF